MVSSSSAPDEFNKTRKKASVAMVSVEKERWGGEEEAEPRFPSNYEPMKYRDFSSNYCSSVAKQLNVYSALLLTGKQCDRIFPHFNATELNKEID